MTNEATCLVGRTYVEPVYPPEMIVRCAISSIREARRRGPLSQSIPVCGRCMTMTSISTVDISKISLGTSSPSDEDYQDVAKEIKQCFENIGFMYLSNHGVSGDIIDNAMKASLKFLEED